MSDIGINAKAQAALSQQELTRFKLKMDGLKDRLDSPQNSRDAKLRDACKDFEAVFIGKMWKQMRSSVPKEGYLHSKQEEQYLSMFDNDFSKKMADSGGIGLADMLYEQLSSKLKEASRDALTGKAEIKPLVEENQGIPLNRRDVTGMDNEENMTLDDWMGEGGEASPTGQVSEVSSFPQEASGDATVAAAAPMTDMDVKARLEALARRLEKEAGRIVGRDFASLK